MVVGTKVERRMYKRKSSGSCEVQGVWWCRLIALFCHFLQYENRRAGRILAIAASTIGRPCRNKDSRAGGRLN